MKKTAIIFFILLINITGYSHNLLLEQKVRFENISVNQGLSQVSVNCMLQDSQGFLWVGTQNGLNRYDGYTFKIFLHDPEDPTSLSDNWILSLYEDIDGFLWIGTYSGGVCRYDPEKETFIRFKHNPYDLNSLSSNYVTAVVKDDMGIFWLGTKTGGLNRMDVSTGEITRFQVGTAVTGSSDYNTVNTLCLDKRGSLWIGTITSGLERFDLKSYAFEKYRDISDTVISQSSYISAMTLDDAGNLWIGTEKGLFFCNTETREFTQMLSIKELGQLVRYLMFDRYDQLWIATFGNGIILYNTKDRTFNNYRHDARDQDSLSHDMILSLFEDKSGIIWVGTYLSGLDKMDRTKKSFYHIYQRHVLNGTGISGKSVRSILEDSERNLWVGTDSGGLSVYSRKNNRFYYLSTKDKNGSLTADSVRSVVEDKYGTIWIGTYGGGINKISKGRRVISVYRHDKNNKNSLISDFVRCLYFDRDDVLWVGTVSGVCYFDKEKETFRSINLTGEALTKSLQISSVLHDHNGMIWIASLGGLIRYDKKTEKSSFYVTIPGDNKSLSINRVSALHEDSKNRLWVGTWGGGLNLLDRESGRFTHINKAVVPSNVVSSITEDSQGLLWIGSLNGIVKYDYDSSDFSIYDVNDGLQGNGFNGSSYYKGKDGMLYFGGINGLTMFNPEEILENDFEPQIVLTSITGLKDKINMDISITSSQSITLNYRQNAFSIEFAVLDFSNPAKNNYRYQLEGVDKRWVSAGDRRYVSYSNLKGGSYVFKVKGSNSDGRWSSHERTLKINIIPPFWETELFKVSSFVCAAILIFLVYYLRVKSIRTREKELEQLVLERTNEVRSMNKELVLRNNQLKQINNIVRNINSRFEFKRVIDSIYTSLEEMEGFSGLTVLDMIKERDSFRVTALAGQGESESSSLIKKEMFEQLMKQKTREFREDLYIGESGKSLLKSGDENITSVVIEVVMEDKTIGYIIIDCSCRKDSDDIHCDLDFISKLKDHFVSAFIKAKLMEELKQLSERQSMFLGMAAHDLRNPLSTIKGFADIMLRKMKNGSLTEEYIKEKIAMTNKLIMKMTNLINSLLDLSVVESGKMKINLQYADICQLIDYSIESYRKAAEKKNISLELMLDRTLKEMLVDSERIQDVLNNLISNAIKYTNHNGTIKVWTEQDEKDVVVHVKDSGQGLDEYELKKVFVDVGRLSAKPTGGETSTGLGLMIVKRILDLHSGRIWVKSMKGEGSTFSFALPKKQYAMSGNQEPK